MTTRARGVIAFCGWVWLVGYWSSIFWLRLIGMACLPAIFGGLGGRRARSGRESSSDRRAAAPQNLILAAFRFLRGPWNHAFYFLDMGVWGVVPPSLRAPGMVSKWPRSGGSEFGGRC